jgi:uncharacterized protein (DUF4415 family)
MLFEWDEHKAAVNKAKHKVSFETASLVFSDPRHISIQDRFFENEERWQTLGAADGIAIRPTGVRDRYMSKASERKNELKKLAAKPDKAINKTDILSIDENEWRKRGQVGRFYRPIKKAVTIRLDADVLEWFKSHNAKYQKAVNQVLRAYMESHSDH